METAKQKWWSQEVIKSLVLGKEQNRGLVSNSAKEAVGQGNAASTLSHHLSSQESVYSDHGRKEEAAPGGRAYAAPFPACPCSHSAGVE